MGAMRHHSGNGTQMGCVENGRLLHSRNVSHWRVRQRLGLVVDRSVSLWLVLLILGLLILYGVLILIA